MKNDYVEKQKRNAKLFHKNNKRNAHYEDELLIHHLYSDANDKALSWWDDFGFILNDYRVSVAWIHPRQAFSDQVSELAHEKQSASDHTQDVESFSIEKISTPVYKKVGRSRKIISMYRSNFLPDERYYTELKKTKNEIAQSTDLTIVPTVDIHWTGRSRFVSACIPMEVCNGNDLRVLASMIKRLLKRETSLNELFPDYTYTKQNWLKEKDQRAGANDLHIHAIA